ncbi:ATP-binding protein, partial [Bacillus paramycoides]|nr:histidine kinase [Bacillus paramycoides]
IGFVQEQVRESALGLKNMRERIQLMRGSFRIKTEPEKGTKIEIQLPV